MTATNRDAETNGTQTPDRSGDAANEDNPEYFAWFTIFGLLAVTVSLVGFYGGFQRAWEVVFLELAFGAAALSVGGLFGFLFGIPRTAIEGTLTAGENAGGNGSNELRTPETPAARPLTYQPSTNLEQVSDWLTKILIGAGLVQLGAISQALADAGSMVETTFGSKAPGLAILTQLVIVTFAVIGFLATFLWTRIYYGRMLVRADQRILQELRNLKSETAAVRKEAAETKKTLSLVASGELVGAAPTIATPVETTKPAAANELERRLPAEVQKKIDAIKRAPVDWESDPAADIFADASSESNGRRLEGSIVTDLGDGLTISLRVSPLPGAPPLVGEVAFVLHPTFAERIITAPVANNRAEINIYSMEWFTVAAIADQGQTVLTYSLRSLPGAPKWFLAE